VTSGSASGLLNDSCEFVVGWLLEIRVAAGYRTVADVDEVIRMTSDKLKTLPSSGKFVAAADWRAVQLMSPDTASRARELLQSANPRLKRSAILTLPESPLTNLQVVRLIREAENAHRRHFISAAEMHAWLAEVLTEQESSRLATFLGLDGSPPVDS
jgi:hypothetical protein